MAHVTDGCVDLPDWIDPEQVTATRVSTEGVAWISQGDKIYQWDLFNHTGKCIKTISSHETIRGLYVIPGDKMYVYASGQYCVSRYVVSNGTVDFFWTWSETHEKTTNKHKLYIGSSHGYVYEKNSVSWFKLDDPFHLGKPKVKQFSRGSKIIDVKEYSNRLYVITEDVQMYIIDLTTGETKQIECRHGSYDMTGLIITTTVNGPRVFTSRTNGLVEEWDIYGNNIELRQSQCYGVYGMTVRDAGRTLCFWAKDGTVYDYDLSLRSPYPTRKRERMGCQGTMDGTILDHTRLTFGPTHMFLVVTWMIPWGSTEMPKDIHRHIRIFKILL